LITSWAKAGKDFLMSGKDVGGLYSFFTASSRRRHVTAYKFVSLSSDSNLWSSEKDVRHRGCCQGAQSRRRCPQGPEPMCACAPCVCSAGLVCFSLCVWHRRSRDERSICAHIARIRSMLRHCYGSTRQVLPVKLQGSLLVHALLHPRSLT
jgi:hypothetical protein